MHIIACDVGTDRVVFGWWVNSKWDAICLTIDGLRDTISTKKEFL
jgi:hypothetical protein